MGLALALVRHLAAADASMKVGQWEKSKFTGDELSGRTLGLVGFGRIGREVAQRARAFDMTVLTADPFLSAEAASRRRRRAGRAWTILLARADVISLHAPSTAETRHIINSETLAKVKKGARLINTARGELIDTAALIEALKSGQARRRRHRRLRRRAADRSARSSRCRRSSPRRILPRRRAKARSASVSTPSTPCASSSSEASSGMRSTPPRWRRPSPRASARCCRPPSGSARSPRRCCLARSRASASASTASSRPCRPGRSPMRF